MENPVNWLLRQKNKLVEVKIPQISDIVTDCESPTKSDRSSPNKKIKVPRCIGNNVRPPLF